MYNYHSHTKRCGHAVGEDEEYVKAAIEGKYDAIGFTDHVMLPFCTKENNIRAPFKEKRGYLKSINKLKSKYSNQIIIYVGFECEYDDLFVPYYKKLIEDNEVDYLIFGNHFLEFRDGEFFYVRSSPDVYVNKYADYAIKAMETGLFKIMAHPDLFMAYVTEFNDTCRKASRRICECALKNNVALEVNCGPANWKGKTQLGNEYRWLYPYDEFWKIAKEIGNTIVIGLDAHDPKLYIQSNRNQIEEFVKALDLTITDKLDTIQ